MRIAVVADIHGNLFALEAVLDDIGTQRVDQIVNLGDLCSGPLLPAETADRLMALAWPTIRGNHERQLLTLPTERMGLSDRHAATALGARHLAWFDSLPARLRPLDDVLMVHGTSDSDLAYFLHTVTPDGLRVATRTEIAARASNTGAAVILCGHTHLPRIVTLDDGRMIVNPGSVGLPAYDDDRPYPHVVESGSPHARYAILSRHGSRWHAEIRTVAYDWDRAARLAEANRRPDWASALRTGALQPAGKSSGVNCANIAALSGSSASGT